MTAPQDENPQRRTESIMLKGILWSGYLTVAGFLAYAHWGSCG